MNTRNMYALNVTPDQWAEVYANRRIQAWADQLYDLEWTDPDDGMLKARANEPQWQELSAAADQTEGFARFVGASDAFNAKLLSWLRRFQ